MNKSLFIFFISITFQQLGHAQAKPELWWWQGIEPNSAANVAAIEAQIDAAVTYGYTGIALWEGSISWLGTSRSSPQLTSNIQQVVAYAQSKGLKTMATVSPYGYSDNVLLLNGNLAEGQHITGSQFQVNASQTQLVPVNSFPGLANPGFESGLTGWNGSTDPGIAIDITNAHSGKASAVITNSTSDSRFYQVLSVTPWRQYHVRYWVKTQNFSSTVGMMEVYDAASGLALYNTSLQVSATQDWTEYDFTFNSRTTMQPALYFGVWGSSTGSVWFDDIFMEETSLVYVLRRAGTPLSIYDPANPSTIYQEGRDVNAISDPNISSGAGFVDQYHTPMTLTLPAGTTLPAGKIVAMDYYAVQPVASYGDVGMCLTDPAAQSMLQTTSQAVTTALGSTTGYLLSYDEMRHMDSCATCKAKNMSPGQLLGWHVGQTYSLYQSLAPGAQTYVWGDMFDPYQNAVNNYYFVEGNISGSWSGLPPQITILNWNLANLTNSLKWFSGTNSQQPTPFRQIIAGYYDSGDGAGAATQEIQAALGIPGIAGLMYTTWIPNYSQLQNFATAAKTNWASYLASLPASTSPVPPANLTAVAK